MNKVKRIRIKLVKGLALLLAMVGGSYTFYGAIADFSQTIEQEISKNDMDRQKLIADTDEIKRRVGLSEEAVKFYNNFKSKNGEGDKLFRRETLINTLVELKQEMLLSDMQYTLSAFEEKRDGKIKKESVAVIAAKVEMEFAAATDVIALKAIKELMHKLPGFIDVVEFSMEKTRDFTPQDIVEINAGKGTAVVKCKLTFNWLGVKDIKKIAEQNQTTPPQT